MANGTIHRLGSLYVGGAPQPMPMVPKNSGDVYDFDKGSGPIEIRDTAREAAMRLQFVEVNLTSTQASALKLPLPTGQILICNRCIVGNISWEALDDQGLIAGRNIMIDEQPYKIMSPTGGKNPDDPNNIWDKILCNTLGLPGLPIGTADDRTEACAHNQMWHWKNMYTWCPDVGKTYLSYRAIRGYSSAVFWGHCKTATGHPHIGFRPVLIPLNAPL